MEPTLGDASGLLYLGATRRTLCSIAPVLISRIAACWRNSTRYELRGTDASVATEAEGRAI